MDTRNDSAVSLKPIQKIGENGSQLIITATAEGEENNFDTVPVDAISAFSPEKIGSTSSSKTKCRVIFYIEHTVVFLISYISAALVIRLPVPSS